MTGLRNTNFFGVADNVQNEGMDIRVKCNSVKKRLKKRGILQREGLSLLLFALCI